MSDTDRDHRDDHLLIGRGGGDEVETITITRQVPNSQAAQRARLMRGPEPALDPEAHQFAGGVDLAGGESRVTRVAEETVPGQSWAALHGPPPPHTERHAEQSWIAESYDQPGELGIREGDWVVDEARGSAQLPPSGTPWVI